VGIGKNQYRKTYNFTHGTYSRPLFAQVPFWEKDKGGKLSHIFLVLMEFITNGTNSIPRIPVVLGKRFSES
jgi:hypothetical protein